MSRLRLVCAALGVVAAWASAWAQPDAPIRQVSSDGRWSLVANRLPYTLQLLDAAGQLHRSYPASTLDGKRSSRVTAVLDLPARRSFVALLPDIAQLWEISYDPGAGPIYDGLVHDYRMGEALATPGYLGVRRTPLEEPLEGITAGRLPSEVTGLTRPGSDGRRERQVINLDVRRRVATLPP